jgi:MFS transporter, CP family, cyanate transporter
MREDVAMAGFQRTGGTRRMAPNLAAAWGRRARGRGWLLLVAVVLLALNLRGPLAAVSPMLPELRSQLGLGGQTAGLLTTLPVLCFAGAAPLAAWLGRRIGLDRALLAGVIGIAAATALRSAGGVAVLFVGTVLLGVAVTVGNVLIPAVVKQRFPGRVGTVTGIYTAALIGGAAVTAAASVPLAGVVGWRLGLGVWALLAAVAACVWIAAGRSHDSAPATAADFVPDAARGPVWRHRTAWAIAVFFGTQSMIYFAMTAWLPSLLIDTAGLVRRAAGVGLSVFQLAGIAGTLVAPPLATRMRRQRALTVGLAVLAALSLAGLLEAPSAWSLWAAAGGLAVGAALATATTLIVLRTRHAATTRRLSAMAQTVAYAIAASGPVVVGGLYGATGSWAAPLILLIAVAGVMAAAGTVSGRQVLIDDEPVPAA